MEGRYRLPRERGWPGGRGGRGAGGGRCGTRGDYWGAWLCGNCFGCQYYEILFNIAKYLSVLLHINQYYYIYLELPILMVTF